MVITMKLIDLNPKFEEVSETGFEYLIFDCPVCKDVPLKEHELEHSFVIPISGRDPKHWDMKGRDFASLTISPSILDMHRCQAHFFIRDGQIVIC